MPSAFDVSVFHLISFFLLYTKSCSFRNGPIFNAIHLLKFNVKPDSFPNSQIDKLLHCSFALYCLE